MRRMADPYGMLGLAMRAGKVQTGESVCEKLVKTGKACLILIDGAASANTVKAVTDTCTTYRVPLRRTENGRLGSATGKQGRMVACITDAGFAERLKTLIPENDL